MNYLKMFSGVKLPMINVDTCKEQLVENLWLPYTKEAGQLFYPRLRKNKKMKIFSLTNENNLSDILKFEENNLIQRDDCIVWARTSFKKIRLETESVGGVLGPAHYPDTVLTNATAIAGHFPRDIINLDFSSQDIAIEDGRIEKEISSVEKTIELQNNSGGDKFLLFFTTIIDDRNINAADVKATSDAIQMNGWAGLNIEGFTSPIVDLENKKSFLREVISRLCAKYGYECTKIDINNIDIPSRTEKVFSVAGLFCRRG